MSCSNVIRIPLVLPNVNVFTFGESFLVGYDSSNKCLVVRSLNDMNNFNDHQFDRFYLLLSPTSTVRQMILNPDQTSVALISDETAYIVFLPELKSSFSKVSRQCPTKAIPPLSSNSASLNSVIDFVWLSSMHFIVVFSYPLSSECHLYSIRPSQSHVIEFIQTFSVGFSSSSLPKEQKSIGTTRKNGSLFPSPSIVKLDFAIRKNQDVELILLFAMKSDGDIFLMEIDQKQLLNNNKRLTSEFVGPICILPSTTHNYGADHHNSDLVCLSCSPIPIVIFTSDKCSIYQCIVLTSSMNQYSLFTIDSISLPTNENNRIIKSIIIDKLNSNMYYVRDSSSNIYSIEMVWIHSIDEKKKQIQPTNIQHLIKSNDVIHQMGLIQTSNKGQWLAFLTETKINAQKELILIRPGSLSLTSLNSRSIEYLSSIETKKLNKSKSTIEYVDRIRKILHCDQSLPHIAVPSSSSKIQNISDSDFEKNLLNCLTLISQQYIEKQEKVRLELVNKQRYLYDFQQTQLVANQELYKKFEQIQQRYDALNQQYQQEYGRRTCLSQKFNELLSIIEENTPVVSDKEILMQKQLESYPIRMNSLKEKISLLKQFISGRQETKNKNRQHVDQSFMEEIKPFIQYFTNQIYEMKQILRPFDHSSGSSSS